MSIEIRAHFTANPVRFNLIKAEPSLSQANRDLAHVKSKVQSPSGVSGTPERSRRQLLSPDRLASDAREYVQVSNSIFEKLFDSLVALKVSVSQYAMHIPTDARADLFSKLDEVLDIDSWYEEDELPDIRSFTDFLRWTIHSKFFSWKSLGISDEGSLLLAFRNNDNVLTASFLGNDHVRWTAKVNSEDGVQYAAGKSSLRYFTKQVNFYLQ